jgi:hypothetical protein
VVKLLLLLLAGVVFLMARGPEAFRRAGLRIGRHDPAYLAGRGLVRRADAMRREQEAKVTRYLSFLEDDDNLTGPHLTKPGAGQSSDAKLPPPDARAQKDRPDRRPKT